MSGERNLEQLLHSWIDEGAEVAPEPVVWAALTDVERTAQRQRWRISLEVVTMRARPAVPVLAVAAVVILAIAAYLALARPNVGGPTATPTRHAFVPSDLPSIVLAADEAPSGMSLDEVRQGATALVSGLPPGSVIDRSAFVDARLTQFTGSTGRGVATWAALFRTTSDAADAYAFVVARHEADDGWALRPSTAGASFGDEGVSYTGAAYGFDRATIYLWRIDNLLLATIGVNETDPSLVRSIAEQIAARSG